MPFLSIILIKNKNNKKSHSRQAISLFIDLPCQVLLCRHTFYDKASVSPFMTINNASWFWSVLSPQEVGTSSGLTVPGRPHSSK